MLPIELVEYEDGQGRNPFEKWFSRLDDQTAARVNTYLQRLSRGNFSNVKGVAGGVSELKMDFGPGYRIYFGRDGLTLIILLGGGTKKQQQNDIADAQSRCADYKRTKQGGR